MNKLSKLRENKLKDILRRNEIEKKDFIINVFINFCVHNLLASSILLFLISPKYCSANSKDFFKLNISISSSLYSVLEQAENNINININKEVNDKIFFLNFIPP